MFKVFFEENKLYFLKVVLVFWCLLEVLEDVIIKMCIIFFEYINSII